MHHLGCAPNANIALRMNATLQVRGSKLLLSPLMHQLESQGTVRQFAASQGVAFEQIWLLLQTGECDGVQQGVL